MDRLDSLTLSSIFLCAVGFLHSGFDAVASGFLIW
jgi:phosphatidate cytidylyltransferase